MPKFVDDLHVAGALQASADPAKVTNTLQKAVGQSVDIEQYLDTDGTTVKGKVDANFIATFQALIAAGLTGATSAARYVGATTSGAPASGTFLAGDWVISKADAKVYVCTAGGTPGTWTTPAGSAVPGIAMRLASGRYVANLPSGVTTGALSNSNTGFITFSPVTFARAVTLTTIGIEVSTAVASSLVRLGLYTDSSGLAGSLVADFGTVDSTTTGVKTITISQAVSATDYWLAAVQQGGASQVLVKQNTAVGVASDSRNTVPTSFSSGSLETSSTFGSGGLPSSLTLANGASNGTRFLLGI